MRNIELMFELLEDMADTIDGSIMVPRRLGNEDSLRKFHQAEILVDCGLVQWRKSKHNENVSVVRITNRGYDLLEVRKRDPKNFFHIVDGQIYMGRSFIKAVDTAMLLVGRNE